MDVERLKEETYSCGAGVRKGALLALKHINALIREYE
jgi:hypothetical protein